MNTALKPTFEHNGVTITLGSDGKFRAHGPTGLISSSSLDGIKKRLDKNGTFTPFKAFTVRSYYSSLEEFTVIGFVRCYGLKQWKLDKGGPMSEVYEDTPANRELAKQYMALCEKHRKLKEQFDEEKSKLLAKLKVLRP